MKETVTLTIKEQKRLKVIGEAEAGRITVREAAELLGLSERQVKRLKKAYREKGAAGLAHGNRGKTSTRRTPEEIRKKVVELSRERYPDYNDQHFTEQLAEQHGIVLSRCTVRAIRRAAGLGSPRKRCAPRHRQRRERRPMSGMLLQADGSDHDWLEGRGPRLALVSCIDDATNEVPAARFREEEDAVGYLLVLQDICLKRGIPGSVYADRHTIFRSPKEATLEEQLTGKQPRSQVGRVLDELAIEYIPAYSPQAKGRVERLFGTLQDRLVKALREANASTLAEANAVLETFLPDYNQKFTKEAAQPGSAYREWPADLRPSDVFCFKYTRTVSNDNTISFSGHRLPLPPGPQRRSYARGQVEIRQHLDGQLTIHYQGQQIAAFDQAADVPVRVGKFTPALPPAAPAPARPAAPPARPTSPPRQPYKPAPNHPWRRGFQVSASYGKD